MSLIDYKAPIQSVPIGDTVVQVRSISRLDLMQAVVSTSQWSAMAGLIGDRTDAAQLTEAEQVRAGLLVLTAVPDILVGVLAAATGEAASDIARLPLGDLTRVLEAAVPAA